MPGDGGTEPDTDAGAATERQPERAVAAAGPTGADDPTEPAEPTDEPTGGETTLAELSRLAAGVAAIGGGGLTFVSGAVLTSGLVAGDQSPILRFGALAGLSVGLFLLWWGGSVLWLED